MVVCGKCGYHMSTKYHSHKLPAYDCDQIYGQPLDETCGSVKSQPVDELVAQQVLRALEPASLELSLRAVTNVEQERKRLHDQWSKKRERARHDVERAERQYQVVEPENRLVARTLEARWEDALARQREVEEDYHRFAAQLPSALSDVDRERILSLSENVANIWNASETSVADRKQIIRCLVERVVVFLDKCSEFVDVRIEWRGGFSSQHQVVRPVGCYEQLRDYGKLTARIAELHSQGLHVPQIADRLNEEGFVPP